MINLKKKNIYFNSLFDNILIGSAGSLRSADQEGGPRPRGKISHQEGKQYHINPRNLRGGLTLRRLMVLSRLYLNIDPRT